MILAPSPAIPVRPVTPREKNVKLFRLPSIATLLFVLISSRGLLATETDARPVWVPREGQQETWRLELRERLEIIIPGRDGKPLTPRPRLSTRRHLDATCRLEWNRIQDDVARARVTLSHVHHLSLDDWTRPDPRPSRPIRFTVTMTRTPPLQVQVGFREAEVRTLFQWSERDPERTRRLRELLTDAWKELGSYRVPEKPGAWKPGHRWKQTRRIPLHDDLSLDLTRDLEILRVKSGLGGLHPRVMIEGAVRQSIPGAPSELARHPGLFPGTVQWIHDPGEGRPHWIETRLDTEFPIPDRRLPLIQSLSRERRFRAGSPETFEEHTRSEKPSKKSDS